MSVEVSQEVDRYFAEEANKAGYRQLPKRIDQLCQGVRHELGDEIVRGIYSRENKQGGNPFKTPTKIAKALTEKRLKDPDAPVTAIEDIIGLTIVVYYPDQIDAVLQRIEQKVRIDSTPWMERHKAVIRNGYHGHHITLISNGSADADMKCEVRSKTMMHDAWSAKMHDLN